MKRLLFFLVMFLFVGNANAQTSQVLESNFQYQKISSSLIGERQGPSHSKATVSCFNTETDSVPTYFLNNPNNTNVIYRDLPGNFEVNDMEVTVDTVFFCGTDNNTGNAFIGFFDIDDLFYGSGNFNIQQTIIADSLHNAVKELTRMETFTDNNGMRHVVCIGSIHNSSYPCIVDMQFIGMGFINYTVGRVADEKESFTDIKILKHGPQNCLVTSGFNTQHGRFICLRVYDINNMFGAPYYCNNRYTFDNDYTPPIRRWSSESVLLSRVTDDVFSTVSFRNNYTINGKPDTAFYYLNQNIHIGFFNIFDLWNNNNNAMFKHIEMHVDFSSGKKTMQFECSNKNQLPYPTFLINYSVNSVKSHYFCEIDYSSLTTTGSLPFYSYFDNTLFGMSVYDHNDRYIMNGYKKNFKQYMSFEMETFGGLKHCPDNKMYDYFTPSAIYSTYERIEFSEYYGIVELKTYKPEFKGNYIRSVCED